MESNTPIKPSKKNRNPFQLKSQAPAKRFEFFRPATPKMKTPMKHINFFSKEFLNSSKRGSEFALSLNDKEIKKQKLQNQLDIKEDEVQESENDTEVDSDIEFTDKPQVNINKMLLQAKRLDHIPRNDHSLKTKIVLTSSKKLDDLQLHNNYQYQHVNPPSYAKLIERLLTKPKRSHLEDLEFDFYKAQYEEYLNVFMGLFKDYRLMKVNEFIYMNEYFMVIFCRDGQLLQAKLSKASTGLIKILNEQKIHYETLNIDPFGDHKIKHDLGLQSNNAQSDQKSSKSDLDDFNYEITNIENRRASTKSLIFRKQSVLALFDFLLNWKDPNLASQTKKSPLLLSSTEFLGSKITNFKIYEKKILNESKIFHKTMIEGYLFNENLGRFWEWISKNRIGDCKITFDTALVSVFNGGLKSLDICDTENDFHVLCENIY